MKQSIGRQERFDEGKSWCGHVLGTIYLSAINSGRLTVNAVVGEAFLGELVEPSRRLACDVR